MTWQEFFRVRIAEPLDMTSTTFNLIGFNRNPDTAGGARSTAEDYTRFLTMLLQNGVWSGRRILSEQAVAQIEQDQAPGSTIIATPYTTVASLLPSTSGVRPGLGMWREETDSSTGTLLIASCPGTYGFTPWIDYKLNLAGVLSMQYDLGKAAYAVMRVRQLVPQAIAAGVRFQDVPTTSWAFAAIVDLSARGLVTGYETAVYNRQRSHAVIVCQTRCTPCGTRGSSDVRSFNGCHVRQWASRYVQHRAQGLLTGSPWACSNRRNPSAKGRPLPLSPDHCAGASQTRSPMRTISPATGLAHP